MNSLAVDQFVELEEQVWRALVSGDMDADARLLAEDFLGVYGSGFADRASHVGQLRDGATILSYSLSEARIQVLASDVVLLSYRAQFVRRAGNSEAMYISSIWRLQDGSWRNVFSQDTLAES